jgi:hypothetical protein
LGPAHRWKPHVRSSLGRIGRSVVCALIVLGLAGVGEVASAEATGAASSTEPAGAAEPVDEDAADAATDSVTLECDRGQDPQARAVLVDEGPIIDGVIDDAVWAQAEVITELTKVTPRFCEPPTFRTEIRILTDGEVLYLSMRAFDDAPGEIVRNRMARSETFFYDDNFTVLLDTFHDRQNGFFFQVNPNGGRRDGSFTRGNFEENWEGIWYAQASIDEEGWSAEMAIPFKTLPFRPGVDDWGLQLFRRIRRWNEEDRWADPSLQRFGINMSRAGTLHGMEVAEQGIGLDVVPNLSVGGVYDHEGQDNVPEVAALRDFDDHGEARIEPSLDAFYRVTPSLLASVTANTDFAQTEIDAAQLNLTRFDLFFPEKREFFLRDTGIFQFADLASENGLPFFSRRIGIDSGTRPVRILGGGRLTGRVGRFNIGFIDIQQDRNAGREGENLAVARVSANVLKESNVGVLLTHGDPESDRENLLAGADFNYRSSELVPNRFVSANLWMQQNFSGGSYGDRSSAWGGTLSYPNDIVQWQLRFKDIQRGFDPALGFVNRSDIRVYDADYRYRFRWEDEWIQTYDIILDTSYTTDRTDHLESAAIRFSPLKITNAVEDSIELQAMMLYEDTVFPFYLAEHIGIPPGEYAQYSGLLYIRTGQHRPVRFEFDTGIGEFFGGWGVRFAPLIEWRPNHYLLFSVRYDERIFYDVQSCYGGPGVNCVVSGDVKKRQFNARLTRFRAQIAFTPDLIWDTIVQYENLKDRVEMQTRLRWIIVPGREFYLILGQDLDAKPGDFRVRETQPIAKLRWTFRF